MWPIMGPLVAIGQTIFGKLYDRFERSTAVRLEMVPGLAGYPDRSLVAFIIVTVRNQGTPQKVEDVALQLSNGQYLLMPMPHPSVAPPEDGMVTTTQPYQIGFELEEVKAKIAEEEAQTGRRVGVVGARARLVSGRTVRLRKKIDLNNQALFQFQKPGNVSKP